MLFMIHNIHNNLVDEVKEGMQGMSWMIFKEYITIKQAIVYTITCLELTKAWPKLMQLDTVQLVLPEAICY